MGINETRVNHELWTLDDRFRRVGFILFPPLYMLKRRAYILIKEAIDEEDTIYVLPQQDCLPCKTQNSADALRN